jgi:hypothetical protein
VKKKRDRKRERRAAVIRGFSEEGGGQGRFHERELPSIAASGSI